MDIQGFFQNLGNLGPSDMTANLFGGDDYDIEKTVSRIIIIIVVIAVVIIVLFKLYKYFCSCSTKSEGFDVMDSSVGVMSPTQFQMKFKNGKYENFGPGNNDDDEVARYASNNHGAPPPPPQLGFAPNVPLSSKIKLGPGPPPSDYEKFGNGQQNNNNDGNFGHMDKLKLKAYIKKRDALMEARKECDDSNMKSHEKLKIYRQKIRKLRAEKNADDDDNNNDNGNGNGNGNSNGNSRSNGNGNDNGNGRRRNDNDDDDNEDFNVEPQGAFIDRNDGDNANVNSDNFMTADQMENLSNGGFSVDNYETMDDVSKKKTH